MNTLLAGFGPFLDIASNPTERLVRHFERSGIAGHSLTTCVLPVSYHRAPALLLEAIERGDEAGRPFELVWMMGVASTAECWRVEGFGRNQNAAVPDADGFRPPSCIDPDGPPALAATVPVDLLVSALGDGGLPAVFSESAGAYLCNHVLYTALRWADRSGAETRIGFLHVPADTETFQERKGGTRFTFAHQVRAVETCLATLAGAGRP